MSSIPVTPKFVPSPEQLAEPLEPRMDEGDSLIARLTRDFPDSADDDLPVEYLYDEPEVPGESDGDDASK